MGTFIGAAAKRNSDIRSFLREAVAGNSLKYVAEKNSKHCIYIPYNEEVVNVDGVDTVSRGIIAINGKVHDWHTPDGKYRSTVCLDGVVMEDDKGNVVNDGTCPFCDRVSDAWDIYKIRMDREEKTCGKAGEELTKYIDDIKSKVAEERKAKSANEYIYILVAKFRQDSNGAIEIDQNTKLPAFDLKVMKLSAKRAEKINKSVENAGMPFAGSEIMFDYPNTDDVRHMSTDCVTVPIAHGTTNSIITRFPEVEKKILEEAQKFSWDTIDKPFPEWKGMTLAEARLICNGLFKKYDEYKAELTTNPNAKYMEYLSTAAVNNPALETGTAKMPEIPTVNTNASELDPNKAFGGIGAL